RKRFDRNGSSLLVTGEENDAHVAAAEFAHDLVSGRKPPGERRCDASRSRIADGADRSKRLIAPADFGKEAGLAERFQVRFPAPVELRLHHREDVRNSRFIGHVATPPSGATAPRG